MDVEPQPTIKRRHFLRLGIIGAGAGILGKFVVDKNAQQSPQSGAKETKPVAEGNPALSMEQQLKGIAERAVGQSNFPELLYPVSADQALPDSFGGKEDDLPLITVNPTNPSELGHFSKESPYTISKVIQKPLADLFDAAKKDGHRPFLKSGFRDVKIQTELFNARVNILMGKGLSKEDAEKKAAETNAAPMHSEHQLGTAADIFDMDMPDHDYLPGHNDAFDIARAQYKEKIWGWLREHAHEHGFVLSYPTGKVEDEKNDIQNAKPGSGVKSAEPWHIRFVGVELATQMYEDGYLNPETSLTLDAVLKVVERIK